MRLRQKVLRDSQEDFFPDFSGRPVGQAPAKAPQLFLKPGLGLRGMMGYCVGHEGGDQDGERLRHASLDPWSGLGSPELRCGVRVPGSWRRSLWV